MKRIFATIIALAVLAMAHAQFKIHSNGYVSIQSNATPFSPVSINSNGIQGYQLSMTGSKDGFYCVAKGENTDETTYAGRYVSELSTAHSSTGLRLTSGSASGYSGKSSIGIISEAGGGKRNIGVLGRLLGNRGGAAIYGTTSTGSDFGTPLLLDTARYAGYFSGRTKVTENLIVGGYIQGILLGSSASTIDSSQGMQRLSAGGSDISNKLSCLSAIAYQEELSLDGSALPEASENDEREFAEGNTSSEKIKEASIIKQRYDKRTRFALNADELEKVFPELVYNQADGSKAINYMDMIPLLVQTINELNNKITILENVSRTTEMIAPEGGVNSINNSRVSFASLKQNVPNPFVERTTISFSLPENVSNAYIYIFDMTGKMQKQLAINSSMESITINGGELSAGMYIYSLVINGQEVDTKRMILSK